MGFGLCNNSKVCIFSPLMIEQESCLPPAWEALEATEVFPLAATEFLARDRLDVNQSGGPVIPSGGLIVGVHHGEGEPGMYIKMAGNQGYQLKGSEQECTLKWTPTASCSAGASV